MSRSSRDSRALASCSARPALPARHSLELNDETRNEGGGQQCSIAIAGVIDVRHLVRQALRMAYRAEMQSKLAGM